MCLGGDGDGGAGAAAADAAAKEKARRDRIAKGTKEIDRVFDGTTRGVNPVNAIQDRNATYYLEDGTPVQVVTQQTENPDYLAYMQRKAEIDARPVTHNKTQAARTSQLRQSLGPAPQSAVGRDFLYSNGKQIAAYGSQPIFSGTQVTPGFGEEYFDDLENKYMAYAQPKLDDQFGDAKKNLIYALSRNNLLNSSTASNKQADLNEEFSAYQTDVANSGKQYSNQARSNVESTRSGLIAQLNATEDPAAAAAAATRQAALLSQPPAFSPVGQFVFNAAQGLQDMSNRATGYKGYASQPIQFSSGRSGGSGSVTRV